MKLFSRKKSNSAIRDQQQQPAQTAPPNISRPRAQGHLPPTTGPRQTSSTPRRSFSSGTTALGTEPVTTPLYARFARADSIENLNLNLRKPADSRSPSFAPTQAELEEDASKLGYERPWAQQERPSSLDSSRTLPDPTKPRVVEAPKPVELPKPTPAPAPTSLAPSSNGPDRSRSPLASGSSPTLRMVSNPVSSSGNRKSTADKRLSIDAAIAADPFMASKLQSVLRRAPSNANQPTPPTQTLLNGQPPAPVPSRSSTAPPPPAAPASRSNPPSRAPTAPPSAAPSRSVSNSRTSTVSRGGPPPTTQNYRPSMDGGMSSDDGHSTFSHSNTGHSNRPVYSNMSSTGSGYPSSAANRNAAQRERGPPPVAGTHSAYAWRSGQSDDGHGGGSNFYTGGSQSQPLSTNSFPSLPPGALPPLPPGAQPPQLSPGMPPMPSGQRKRTPSNPPVSRVPHPGPGPSGRRMSIDAAGVNSNLDVGVLGGGPGTWGGVAPGPDGYQQRASIGLDAYQQRTAPAPPPVEIGRRTSTSVQPGEIFHHPQVQVGARKPVQDAPVGGADGQERGRGGMRLVSSSQPQPQPQLQQPQQPNVRDGRQSPSKANGRQSPAKSSPATEANIGGRQSPQKVENRQGPFKNATTATTNANLGANDGFKPEGRQSPFKSEGRQSPSKPEGRQSPVKPAAISSSPPKSLLSVDTAQSVRAVMSSSPARATASSSPAPSMTISSNAATVSTTSVTLSTSPAPLSTSPVPRSTSPAPTPMSPARTTVSTSSYRTALSPATTVASTPFGPTGQSLYASPIQSSSSAFQARDPNAAATLIRDPFHIPGREPTRSATRELPPTPTRELSHPPTRPLPPARAPSSTSSYGTAMPLDSEAAFDMGPTASRLALGSTGATLAPINTSQTVRRSPSPGLPVTPRDWVPPTKAESQLSSPMGTAMTARMTPTTPSRTAMSPGTPSRSTPTGPARNGFNAPSPAPARVPSPAPPAAEPAPRPSTSGEPTGESSDGESMHSKKRHLLVKTRKMDGASSFRTSEERSESGQPGDAQSSRPGSGVGDDPFARAPLTVVKTMKKAKMPLTPDATPDPNANASQGKEEDGDTTPRGAMPLSPPLSADDHHEPKPNKANAGLGLGFRRRSDEAELITPALTDNETEAPPMSEIADMTDAGDANEEQEQEQEEMEPGSTTPPGSPPPPKVYPLATHLAMPSLLNALLHELSFRDWNALNALNSGIRRKFEETRALREEVLEFWLRGVGYARWTSPKRENLSLSLRDLNAYMRGVSIAVYRYSAIAESFLAVRAQQEKTNERVQGAASKGNLVRALASSCRAYTKVILRLREQAEAMSEPGEFRSPLLRVGNAPLLRVFVPSKEGAWLSDASVLDCEKELKRAGALGALRVGDVVWDAAVGDEGNSGRMVWDGNYLVDLDYTYSTTGELPKYINSLAFSPSYWHKVIRTSNSPLCHIDLAPYAAEIAQNLQLVQDRVQTETPQGGRHTVVRWVHRSRFHPRPGTVIPNVAAPNTVDRMWEGVIVVEVEGTNEGLADLQARCGSQVRLFPAKTGARNEPIGNAIGKSPFRLLRAMSRPGEIWMRAVREKERLL